MDINFSEKYQNQFVEYHRDDRESFAVGRILAEDDEHIVMEQLNKWAMGSYILLMRKENITSVVTNSRYLKKAMILLQERSKTTFENSIFADKLLEFNTQSGDLLREILQKSQEQKLVVSIDTIHLSNDDAFEGYVKYLDNDLITLDYFGEETTFEIDDICEVRVNNMYDRMDLFVDEQLGIRT